MFTLESLIWLFLWYNDTNELKMSYHLYLNKETQVVKTIESVNLKQRLNKLPPPLLYSQFNFLPAIFQAIKFQQLALMSQQRVLIWWREGTHLGDWS